MNKGLIAVTSLVFGTAIGAAAGWYITKTKYESLIDEEVQSVKDTYNKLLAEKNTRLKEEANIFDHITTPDPEIEISSDSVVIGADFSTTDDIIVEEGYRIPEEVEEEEEEETIEQEIFLEPVKPMKDYQSTPYLIEPEEFGELEDYNVITLNYYADHILADDMNEIIDNPELAVGADNLEKFGSYDGDDWSIYVRNDVRRCDYEVILDDRTYAETL